LKKFQDKTTVDPAFVDKALEEASIYSIMMKFKASENTDGLCHQNPKTAERTVNIEATVVIDIKEGDRMTKKELASCHGVSYGTMNKILHDNLGLVKNSVHWVPMLLSEDQRTGES
jgi:hypothetical protein